MDDVTAKRFMVIGSVVKANPYDVKVPFSCDFKERSRFGDGASVNP